MANQESKSLLNLTHAVYALQTLGLFTVVGFIVAIFINYIKLPDVQGTWLASHFRWQIRTFWFALLWSVIGMLLWVIMIGWLIIIANYIWIIYRIVKGWIYLNDRREILLTR